MTLIEKISKTQDESSWQEFVRYYERYLYVVVRNMNIQHHDCEEIVQGVMLKVWDKLKEFQYHPSKGKFRYWLCAIARNAVIDFIRRQQSQQRRKDGLRQQEEISESGINTLPEVEEIAEREWQNYLANLALDKIRKEFKDTHVTCFLRFTEGIAVADIAKEVDLSENSVYVYKSRVQDSLIKEVKRLEQEIG